jgi:hypothetical protein
VSAAQARRHDGGELVYAFSEQNEDDLSAA